MAPLFIFTNLIIHIMNTLNIIKDSFELWYNTFISKDNKTSIVINYSDTQSFSIKAYHKSCIELCAITIINGISKTTSLIKLEANYNHNNTDEEEAKEIMLKRLLMEIYKYTKQIE